MYLFVHTETGGSDPDEHSLLTAHVALVDRVGLGVIEEKSLAIRPGGAYRVAAGAVVAGLNVAEHWKSAQPAWTVAERLRTFIGGEHPEPIGWDIDRSVRFIRAQLLPEWNDVVDARNTIDLRSVVRFLADAGLMPRLRSLSEAAEYFGLAVGGAGLLVEVYRRARGLVMLR